MKYKLFFVVMMAAGVSFAQSATPESRAASAKLLEVLRMAENFDSYIQQAIQMQRGVLDQMDMSTEEKEQAKKGMEKSMQPVLKKFSWENMKGTFADIYAEVFTAEELNGIIEFYESPAGQKFVEKQPQLTQVTMQKMQGVMAQMMPEIQKEVEKTMENSPSAIKAKQARNIAEVEKAKGVLTLPAVCGLPGAMGLSDVDMPLDSGEAHTNLLMALNIDDISELTVDGDAITIGTLKVKASY